jgi:hypothetical protein
MWTAMACCLLAYLIGAVLFRAGKAPPANREIDPILKGCGGLLVTAGFFTALTLLFIKLVMWINK